jgi:dipeptidyl aminopeptidase/acylaminoacyl peptidase
VLRELATGAERTFAHALDLSFARDGRTLLYTASTKAENDNGLYAVTPGDSAAPAALVSGKGKYTKLTWDRAQTQAVLFSDRDDVAAKTPKVKAYLWTRGTPAAIAVTPAETVGPAAGLVLSDKGTLAFSRDGKKLYLPTAPPPKPPRPAPAVDEDKVTADLWRWNDDYVQPIQKVRANRDRNRTYTAVLDLATQRFTQLADEALATVTLSDDGTRALGSDDRAYRKLTDYDGRYADFALVDPATGTRRPVLKQQRSEGGAPQWSPDGRWTAYYSAKHWHVLNTADGTTRNLTAGIKAAMWNELDDRPEPPSAHGTAGWTKDSQSLLVYDRYDVWQLFPDGRAAKNLTAGHGRATQVVLRVQRIEPVEEGDDERGLDPAKPLVLRGESEATRATGFFRTDFAAAEKKAAPQRLLWGDRSYRYAGRAQEADVLLVTAARFDTFPDVHTTDASFAQLTRVTDGAAQQQAFLWGTGELVKFKGPGGAALSAALYKPANFDPKKKYPLIVYIYERLSQTVHEFQAPRPAQNINVSLYTSNGYAVLTPDIVYKTGQPGQSALKCVLAALDTVVKQGFVDENAVGIQGHSWGGYQIAYMVTQTNRFRAAEAGAPVGNMTSAYSGIRWGTGLPRQFQYERDAEPPRPIAAGRPAALHRQLARFPDRESAHSPAPPAQRCRRRRAVVSGHRALPRAAPPRETGLAFQLQRPVARPAPPRRPERFRQTHAPIFRPLPERRSRPRVDGKRHPVSRARRRKNPLQREAGKVVARSARPGSASRKERSKERKKITGNRPQPFPILAPPRILRGPPARGVVEKVRTRFPAEWSA